MTTQFIPSLDEFAELAKRGNVIPIFAEFIADGETPVSAFRKLDRGGYSIHFHCWQPDTFLDFLVAVREKVGLDMELVAFAPPESEDDAEFIVILAKGRFNGVRLPPGPPPSRIVDTILKSRLAPPLLALRRAAKRTRK